MSDPIEPSVGPLSPHARLADALRKVTEPETKNLKASSKASDFHPLFESYHLSVAGQKKVRNVRLAFSRLVAELEEICGGGPEAGREIALVKTKLEEACFFAVKATSKLNQE